MATMHGRPAPRFTLPSARRVHAPSCSLMCALVVGSTGCDLQEVTIAEPADLVIAEVVLQAGVSEQRALLYRTRGAPDVRVPDATVEVHDRNGGILRFHAVEPFACLDLESNEPDPLLGMCYASSPTSSYTIAPGTTYDLRITLADGGVMTATTTTPDDFAIATPASPDCYLPPDSVMELRWTSAEGAWAYLAETSLAGIRSALDARGVDIDRDPLRLLGLAITQDDTTIAFPSEFGLFDRAEPALADALLAIQNGLPPGVVAHTVIAAVDRNWVNWARGGNFNPSGLVRVPSIRGDGTGVFAAFVVKTIRITTRSDTSTPRCHPYQ